MIADSGIDPKNIACIGISSQRSSFVTWNLKTGKYYHRYKNATKNAIMSRWRHFGLNLLISKLIHEASYVVYIQQLTVIVIELNKDALEYYNYDCYF